MSDWEKELASIATEFKLDDSCKRELAQLVLAEIDVAEERGYKRANCDADTAHDEGYEEGKADAGVGLAEDLADGLRLIDTNRNAAKNLIDRTLREYTGRHLIEVAPCLF